MIEAFREFSQVEYVAFILFILLFLSQTLWLYLGEPSELDDSFEGRLLDALVFALKHIFTMLFISIIGAIIIGIIYFVFSFFVS